MRQSANSLCTTSTIPSETKTFFTVCTPFGPCRPDATSRGRHGNAHIECSPWAGLTDPGADDPHLKIVADFGDETYVLG